MPEDILDSIVEFFTGADIIKFSLLCKPMQKKMERVAKEIIVRVRHNYPSGPIIDESEEDPKSKRVYAEGRNEQLLGVPLDAHRWTRLLYLMEQMTKHMYYLGFQTDNSVANGGGDVGAPLRFLKRQNTLSFNHMYAKIDHVVSPYFNTNAIFMNAGFVFVKHYHMDHNTLFFSTDKTLVSGVYHVIFRILSYCRGGGYVGIMRRSGNGQSNGHPQLKWAQKVSIHAHNHSIESVVGLEYDANHRKLKVYKANCKNKMVPTEPEEGYKINNAIGDLFFGAKISSDSATVKHTQISIRACNQKEWKQFLAHTPKEVLPSENHVRDDRISVWLRRLRRRRDIGDIGGMEEADDRMMALEQIHRAMIRDEMMSDDDASLGSDA